MKAKPVHDSEGIGDVRTSNDRATMFLLGLACFEIGLAMAIQACGLLR
jgi:hypothetical protein